jgi:hypothetical protein
VAEEAHAPGTALARALELALGSVAEDHSRCRHGTAIASIAVKPWAGNSRADADALRPPPTRERAGSQQIRNAVVRSAVRGCRALCTSIPALRSRP